MKTVKNPGRFIFILLFIFVITLTGCSKENSDAPGDDGVYVTDSEIVDTNQVEEITVSSTTHNFQLTSQSDNTYQFQCRDDGCGESLSFTATCLEGTDCITVTDEKITFGAITEATTYSLNGSFYGTIEIDIGSDKEFELSLQGFTLTAEKEVPIYIISGDKVTVSAKKDTDNYIYDIREQVAEDGVSASVYSLVDLDIQGKGNLYIKSVNNNGIHTKDDLKVKNLALQVDSVDNSLKGNDGVTVESGTVTLISRCGDAVKTTNSHLSEKGKQKGDINILGGEILIYAAQDGLDAAHDVVINESEADVNLQIFTDKYSKYSEEVTAVSDEILYIRYSSTAYRYSLEYSNDGGETVWYHSSSYTTVKSTGMGIRGGTSGTQYYYAVTKPSGYTKMRLFVYSSTQEQGQTENYVFKTDSITVNSNYDTLALTSRNGSLSYGWTNYTTNSFSRGGMQEGNSDKGDYSTKGVKADNEITLGGGSIIISSYDDAVHTNNDVELGEEGAYYYGTGNIVISGGELTVHSNDDGIHADGTLTINGGTVKITNSYEGLEGTTVTISGGSISIKSSDDGINATAETGTGIMISDGTLYVYAGGDGLDANSKSKYTGFSISGGHTVVISTGNADSALDTENGYSYTGGYVVAIGRSGGMNGSESVKCSNFSKVGTSKSISLSQDSYLIVSGLVCVKMPTSLSSFVVVLGETSANISSSSSGESILDADGVSWSK